MKNRWGDPLLVQYPVSKIAVWAFVFSGLALGCAAILFVSPSDELRRPIYGPVGAVLLALLQLTFTVAGMALAYVGLLSCPINDLRPGRGLAWAALAASYWSILCLTAILVAMAPILSFLSLAVVAIAMLHILAFATESNFARQSVTLFLIGAMFFSLLSCALLHSRERARLFQCQKNLQELGTNLTLAFELQHQFPSAVEEERRIPAIEEERQILLEQLLEQAAKADTNRNWVPAD